VPSYSSIFILKTFNAASVLVETFTQSYKFTGGAVVTTDAFHNVTVDVSGASANAWDIFGNAGGGLVLGTTTADDWFLIAGGITRGGFESTGEFFLKTHTAYANSEDFKKTNGVSTTDATPTTIFAIAVTDQTSNYATVKIQMRQDTGANRAAFERKFLYYREGAGAVLSSKVHYTFTDKTDVYDVTISPSGNNIIVQVVGIAGQNLYWTGNIEYQGAQTNL